MLRSKPSGGIIASLDVECLFTNIPVDEPKNLILDRVCRHNPDTPKTDIPKDALKKLLQICTKEIPYINFKGHMYQQFEGVATIAPPPFDAPFAN